MKIERLFLAPLFTASFFPLFAQTPPDAGSVRESIARAEAKIAAAETRSDSAAIVEFLADDVVLLPPGEGPVEGKRAAARWLEQSPDSVGKLLRERIEPAELEVRGDLAVERGEIVTQESAPGAPAETQRRTFLSIWRRQSDGSWKIWRNMWSPVEASRNSSAALTAVPSPPPAAPAPEELIALPYPRPLSEGFVRDVQDRLRSFARRIRSSAGDAAKSTLVRTRAAEYLESIIRDVGWIDIRRFGVAAECEAAGIAARAPGRRLWRSALPSLEADLRHSEEGAACFDEVVAEAGKGAVN